MSWPPGLVPNWCQKPAQPHRAAVPGPPTPRRNGIPEAIESSGRVVQRTTSSPTTNGSCSSSYCWNGGARRPSSGWCPWRGPARSARCWCATSTPRPARCGSTRRGRTTAPACGWQAETQARHPHGQRAAGNRGAARSGAPGRRAAVPHPQRHIRHRLPLQERLAARATPPVAPGLHPLHQKALWRGEDLELLLATTATSNPPLRPTRCPAAACTAGGAVDSSSRNSSPRPARTKRGRRQSKRPANLQTAQAFINRWLEIGIPATQVDRVVEFQRRWGGLVLPPSLDYEGALAAAPEVMPGARLRPGWPYVVCTVSR